MHGNFCPCGCQTGCHRHNIMANLSSCFGIGLQRLSPQDFNVAGQYHWRTIQTPKLPTTLGIPGDSVLHTIPGTPATSGVHLSKDAFAAGTNSLAYGFRACTIWMVHGWWMIHRYTDHCTPRSIACAATVCVSRPLFYIHDIKIKKYSQREPMIALSIVFKQIWACLTGICFFLEST